MCWAQGLLGCEWGSIFPSVLSLRTSSSSFVEEPYLWYILRADAGFPVFIFCPPLSWEWWIWLGVSSFKKYCFPFIGACVYRMKGSTFSPSSPFKPFLAISLFCNAVWVTLFNKLIQTIFILCHGHSGWTFLLLVQAFVIFLLPALISCRVLCLPPSFIGAILVSVVCRNTANGTQSNQHIKSASAFTLHYGRNLGTFFLSCFY